MSSFVMSPPPAVSVSKISSMVSARSAVHGTFHSSKLAAAASTSALSVLPCSAESAAVVPPVVRSFTIGGISVFSAHAAMLASCAASFSACAVCAACTDPCRVSSSVLSALLSLRPSTSSSSVAIVLLAASTDALSTLPCSAESAAFSPPVDKSLTTVGISSFNAQSAMLASCAASLAACCSCMVACACWTPARSSLMPSSVPCTSSLKASMSF